MDRVLLLNPPAKPIPDSPFSDDCFLVTTYNPECSPLKDIVQKNWPALGRTANTECIFSKRIIFGNRRNKNLKDTLVHAKITPPVRNDDVIASRKRERQCKSNNCRYCPRLDHTGTITCQPTGRSYSTMTETTCNSNNLIYCIRCTKCSSLYVGQTKNTIKERFKSHFYSISHPDKVDTSVSRHFSVPDHQGLDNVLIYVLEYIKSPQNSKASQRARDEREKTWMHRLASIAPLGLNSAD